MNKYTIVLILFLFNINAFGFENQYLNCTLVKEIKRSYKIGVMPKHFSERQAKSKGLYQFPVQISETKLSTRGFSLFNRLYNSDMLRIILSKALVIREIIIYLETEKMKFM